MTIEYFLTFLCVSSAIANYWMLNQFSKLLEEFKSFNTEDE